MIMRDTYNNSVKSCQTEQILDVAIILVIVTYSYNIVFLNARLIIWVAMINMYMHLHQTLKI